MAAGLEKGEEQEKSRLATRVVTSNHEIFARLKKRKEEYQQWFSLKISGTAEQEGGEILTNCEAWLDAAIKDFVFFSKTVMRVKYAGGNVFPMGHIVCK